MNIGLLYQELRIANSCEKNRKSEERIFIFFYKGYLSL
jgi:hypothetical protein